MSCWLVSEKHVLVVANEYVCRVELGGRRTDSGDYTMIMDVAKVLWSANVKSINARYDETRRRGRINLHNLNLSAVYSGGEVLKHVYCLEYQSDEYTGWADSKANAMLKLLAYDLIMGGASIDSDDYHHAEWGI